MADYSMCPFRLFSILWVSFELVLELPSVVSEDCTETILRFTSLKCPKRLFGWCKEVSGLLKPGLALVLQIEARVIFPV